MTDPVDLKVATFLYREAARAYAFPRPHDEGWDPQLCANCQRIRPVTGSSLCATCKEDE